MFLEHVNLVVADFKMSLTFYQAAFPHWYIRAEGVGEWNGKPRKWLHFGDDYHYIAFSDHGEGANRLLSGHQIGLAHFAYVVKNLGSLITRMQLAGFKVDKGSVHPFRKNAYFIDPNGFKVEFVEYLCDLPCERNSD